MPHKLESDLRLTILGNLEVSGKSQKLESWTVLLENCIKSVTKYFIEYFIFFPFLLNFIKFASNILSKTVLLLVNS